MTCTHLLDVASLPYAVGTERGFCLVLGLYLHTLSTVCSGHPRGVTNSANSLLLKLTVLWVQDWGWPWPGGSSALRGIDQRPPGGTRARVGRSGVSLTCLAPWWTPLGGLGSAGNVHRFPPAGLPTWLLRLPEPVSREAGAASCRSPEAQTTASLPSLCSSTCGNTQSAEFTSLPVCTRTIQWVRLVKLCDRQHRLRQRLSP